MRRRMLGVAMFGLWAERVGAGAFVAACALTAASNACSSARDAARDGAFVWELPVGVAPPPTPAENPMTAAKVELGRFLFYDERLSKTGKYACASCHRQELAFTDGQARAVGATGELHPRSAPGLVNVAYRGPLTWANDRMTSLEKQALVPLLSEHPVELGVLSLEPSVTAALAADQAYTRMFRAAFPDDASPITLPRIADALASFERALVSFRAPYDRFAEGDATALSESARRGLALFRSDRLKCGRCHGGSLFDSPDDGEGPFRNNGLYDVDVPGRHPAGAAGLADLTGRDHDRGRFRIPSLRNVGVTAPYMHDGSLRTLEDVLEHYAAGGRAGAGSRHKSELVVGFSLAPHEREDVLAFLRSLTDEVLLTDPRFGSPFRERAR